MANRTKWTDNARAEFLDNLRKTGNVSESARFVDLSRSRAYELRREDEDFREAWDDAEAEAADVLEREAWRRATEGWEEPVYQGGKLVGHVRKYSDAMLALLLRGHKPNRYATTKVKNEHTGLDGGPIEVKSLDDMTPEEKRQRYIERFGVDPEA